MEVEHFERKTFIRLSRNRSNKIVFSRQRLYTEKLINDLYTVIYTFAFDMLEDEVTLWLLLLLLLLCGRIARRMESN